MPWFTKKKKIVDPVQKKEDLWVVCPACTAHIYREEWLANAKVCPKCSFHERVPSFERVEMLLDARSFGELFPRITVSDPLKFIDAKGSYAEKAKEAVEKTGLKEAVVVYKGKLKGRKVVLGVMDFRFMGGSLGSGTGDKIMLGAQYAFKKGRPFIMICASGGARMHEGVISLMQMARTCAAIARLKQAQIPYLSILTDPTTGGVSASFAMMGDINIAEPKALIAFAGRRVIEQTIKQQLPDDFQTAEYLMDHGFIDVIVPRKDLKDFLANVLKYWRPR
jgi:acetyl-CoA carboxylase carboxyl transferase subunit beta